MADTDLVERLSAHRRIGAAPRQELEWLAAHGTIRRLDVGEVLSKKGARIEALFIVLEGRVAIFVDRSAGRHKIMEWGGGDVTGTLPYSRMAGAPGDAVALEPTSVLAIPRDDFRPLIRECHEVTSILVHTMLDRARAFTSSDLHDEKMVSLGKLSAGFAHELNNPASAIERSAALLLRRLDDTERAVRALGGSWLTEAQLAAVDAVRTSSVSAHSSGVRSPIERAEREEEIADWLADHGVDVTAADILAETAVTPEALDSLARALEGSTLGPVLRWVAAESAVRSLTSDILEASTRITSLVGAIKGFTHMDRATIAEPVDLIHGLDSTVAVLKTKARSKSATVVVQVEPGVPPVRGFSGELNQIWANLIDNALDAIPDSGRVEVLAHPEGPRVVVRVVDNGAGIPADIRERIFEPFFTTKPMGQGTGLGLDIVRRLVLHNDGEISVESKPGRTEFRVVLPAAGVEVAGSNA